MEEDIVICIDNSSYATKNDYIYRTQLEAIRLYARAKLTSNPKNRLSLAELGTRCNIWPHEPHSDLERFLTETLDISWGDEFNLTDGLSNAPFAFVNVGPEIKKRMLVFIAGPPCLDYFLLVIARKLKKNEIALDVVSFEDEDQEFDPMKTKSLISFVAAADTANNNHFARVPLHSTSSPSFVRDILVRSEILRPSEAEAVPLVEEVIPKMINNNNKKKKNHPPVIFPALPQVHQNRFVFGSWDMEQLAIALSKVSENYCQV